MTFPTQKRCENNVRRIPGDRISLFYAIEDALSNSSQGHGSFELGDQSGSSPFLVSRSILCCKVLEHQKHLSLLRILKILSKYLLVEHLPRCLSWALWALGLQAPVETELAHCLLANLGVKGIGDRPALLLQPDSSWKLPTFISSCLIFPPNFLQLPEAPHVQIPYPHPYRLFLP